MTPIRMLNNIESDIDRLLKNRAIMFEWLDKEPKKKWMYVNTKFYDCRSNKKVGSNIVHEYTHTLGFRHDRRRTKRRPHSVSYLMNRIFEECYDHIIGSQASLVKIKLPKRRFWHRTRYEWRREYV